MLVLDRPEIELVERIAAQIGADQKEKFGVRNPLRESRKPRNRLSQGGDDSSAVWL